MDYAMTTDVGDVRYTGTEDRILQLLGSGLSNETVAAAVGVSPQYITNLLSGTEFKNAVSELRFTRLNAHNERDAKYDDIEDELLDKLNSCVDMLYKPREILGALAVINKAQRRGVSTPEQLTTSKEVVALTLPPVVVNKFTVNIQNQVIQAGSQDLVTIQTAALDSLAGLKPVPGARNQVPALVEGNINDAIGLSRDISSGAVGPASKAPEGEYAGGRLTYRSIAAGIAEKVAAAKQAAG
jgi:hypothetical protein